MCAIAPGKALLAHGDDHLPMPRQARLRIPGLPLHVIQRGNNRAPCFGANGDYHVYLSLLDEISQRYSCSIHAFVLMSNHVHLLLTPEKSDSASLLMKHLGQRFVQFINRKYGRTGSLFEGRFRSCVVDSQAYLLRCHRYIEMNPVRANMVTHPSEYRWSSYGANAEGKRCDFLVPHPEYTALASRDEERRERYRSLFDEVINAEELRSIRVAINGGLVLGRDAFIDAFEECFARKSRRGRPGRPAKDGHGRAAVPRNGNRGQTPI